MKKISILVSVAILVIAAVHSCTKVENINIEDDALKGLYSGRDSLKWAKEDSIRKKNIQDSINLANENARLYALYIEDLKAYKKSKHPIMFGWFNSWNPDAPGPYSQLNLLPDSMDIVSIWGGPLI